MSLCCAIYNIAHYYKTNFPLLSETYKIAFSLIKKNTDSFCNSLLIFLFKKKSDALSYKIIYLKSKFIMKSIIYTLFTQPEVARKSTKIYHPHRNTQRYINQRYMMKSQPKTALVYITYISYNVKRAPLHIALKRNLIFLWPLSLPHTHTQLKICITHTQSRLVVAKGITPIYQCS